jgi:ribosomal-protein-alanine N-acetyltransferase
MALDTAFTHFPGLATDRLLLRDIQPRDAPALFAILSDEEAMAFYGHPPQQSLEETRALIAQIQARYARREGLRWGLTLKGDDRLIGSCSLQRFDAGFHRAETGYELHRAFWGRGLMAEAMAAILTYGFMDMGLHRVEAVIDEANARSKGLLLKVGFTYEGRLRERYYFRERFEDEYYYGLLAHEWQKRAQAAR